ncbi:hypothetical protein Rsub_02645 [Raphidocelis subcapitata]|uniref:Uncharacterized protein n=1 Tax=Raphidocelis subcapitata TaxID=307507 RepID=A0A2V0NQN0_9CHLO|nr:hypothetical protein Rsub_02645 [Raphidocelis subcapitata]|eukprot:GBF89941.1 hypothetical protein Rsub_02645 [Raphidocelis subcapitata]
MLQNGDAPPRLRPLPQQTEKGWFLRAVSRVAAQRWVTVGALLAVGVGGIVVADSVAEFVVSKLQIATDDDDL